MRCDHHVHRRNSGVCGADGSPHAYTQAVLSYRRGRLLCASASRSHRHRNMKAANAGVMSLNFLPLRKKWRSIPQPCSGKPACSGSLSAFVCGRAVIFGKNIKFLLRICDATAASEGDIRFSGGYAQWRLAVVAKEMRLRGGAAAPCPAGHVPCIKKRRTLLSLSPSLFCLLQTGRSGPVDTNFTNYFSEKAI